ncbi:MAG: hypothetical protein RLZZ597_262 [Cyanobacteriota bacterium]|jgi:hypothetical protein
MREFHASQALHLRVPHEVIPIEHYLRQPQRLVQAITDPRRIEPREDGVYRLSLRPLHFFGLHVEPTTDLKVWGLADGSLCLEAINCEVRGPDYLSYINDSFSMGLKGILKPHRQDQHTDLQGEANLTIRLDMPPPIKFMPHSVLDATGRTFLSGILMTMKSRIEHHLIHDYRAWVEHTTQNAPERPSALQRRLAQ